MSCHESKSQQQELPRYRKETEEAREKVAKLQIDFGRSKEQIAELQHKIQGCNSKLSDLQGKMMAGKASSADKAKVTALEKRSEAFYDEMQAQRQISVSAQSALNVAEIDLLAKDAIRLGYEALQVLDRVRGTHMVIHMMRDRCPSPSLSEL